MASPIYLDNHATTAVDPRVLDEMLPYFSTKFGNASSRSHGFGWDAEAAVKEARTRIAKTLASKPDEIVFTSGATESINLAIKGSAEVAPPSRRHVVTVCTEHKATLDSVHVLERHGFTATILPVEPSGLVDLERLAAALRPDTFLVSVMAVNNEIGVIQPLGEIGRLCRDRGIIFHCDAAQAFGKLPMRPAEDEIDLLSVSGHKLHAPKGVGFLWVRANGRGAKLVEQNSGGGHEGGRRSGTLNVPGIVGLGKASALAQAEMATEQPRIAALRDRLRDAIMVELDDVQINGDLVRRVAGNLNMSFGGIEGESLLVALKDLAVSSGSACNSQSVQASYVLRAIGVPEDLAIASIRFGLGRFTTEEEVDRAAVMVASTVKKLRLLSRA